MFFIGIFGMGEKAEPAGQSPQMRCPACGQLHAFAMTRRYEYFHVFFIPLIKFHVRYLLTCPGCASVCEGMPEEVKAWQRGQTPGFAIRLIRNNDHPRCPGCGAAVDPSHAYCPHCGHPLAR